MQNFKYKLYRFMQGRYGYDALNWFIFILTMLLLFINIFTHNAILIYVALVLLILQTFRAYSRKLSKRNAENVKFLKLTRPFTHRFKVSRMQVKDRNNRYFICPNCGANIRVPKGRGKITITCPKCSHRFDKRS